MAPHFLSLPIEVKCNIFEHYLSSFGDPAIHLTKSPELRPRGFAYRYHTTLKNQASWTTPQRLALLTTCKQLCGEITPFVYSRLPILVDAPDLAPSKPVDWLTAPLPLAHIASVRHLILDCCHGLNNAGFTSVHIPQQRNLFGSFSALCQVTVVSQLSLIRPLMSSHQIDVRLLQHDSMYLFRFIDDEDTQDTIKEYFRKRWLWYQNHGFKNGSGETINLKMRTEVGRFSAFRDRPGSDQWPQHDQLHGNILVCYLSNRTSNLADVLCRQSRRIRMAMEVSMYLLNAVRVSNKYGRTWKRIQRGNGSTLTFVTCSCPESGIVGERLETQIGLPAHGISRSRTILHLGDQQNESKAMYERFPLCPGASDPRQYRQPNEHYW